MKVSVYNFKSIKAVIDYELKPLNILSGVNSSGKSSFIQLLLLLKETIDLDSSKYQLYLKGELFKVKAFKDILHNKNLSNPLKVSFTLTKKDFEKFGSLVKKSLYDAFDDYICEVEVTFGQIGTEVYISDFYLNYKLPEGDKREQYIKFKVFKKASSEFTVESNVNTFGKGIWNDSLEIEDINYTSIFPISYQTYKKETNPGQKAGEDIFHETRDVEYTNIESIKTYLKVFFEKLYYLGPLREAPKDEYIHNDTVETVGPKGEFVAQVLENFKDTLIPLYLPNSNNDELVYGLREISLLEAVKYWLCDVFEIAANIKVKKVGETYSIILVNYAGLETTVKHVGFGISQILPILVQGLLMPSEGTLVLEQPEIHLHPKIQSKLFDFLFSLTLVGKSIIVETHSDHLITRMRRRIAEDKDDKIKDIINLTFIETDINDLIFRNIALDNFGSMDYFPEDFIEKRDGELRAIVQAQMKKRVDKGSN